MKELNLDFDTVISRFGTHSIKYDFAKQRGHDSDELPLWVADMDFRTTSSVQTALKNVTEHGIFGYSEEFEDYFDAIASWQKERHNWSVERDWLVKTPGVVFALATAIKAFTKEGDSVLIQQPVYYPFRGTIEANKRRVVSNNLVQDKNGKYCIDFDDFEKVIEENRVKLFLLCNPHNPVARVWRREELERLGDICLSHGVIVVSDEIHEDFVFKGKHLPFASIKKEFADNCVVCTSPSKTFNLASMLISNIFIPNGELKKAFEKEIESTGLSQLSIFGLEACRAAYKNGGEWYDSMIKYVAKNLAFIKDFTQKELPGVKMAEHEGTYLAWLDFRALGLSGEELDSAIKNRAKVWLDSGSMFGKSGIGFQRINAACPLSILEDAMNRIKRVL